MHKSKLGGVIIDCDTDDLEAATRFWSHALGMPVHELPGNENAAYRGLTDAQHGLDIEVQQVDHPSRVHLDIETDDINATLGAMNDHAASGRMPLPDSMGPPTIGAVYEEFGEVVKAR